MPSINILNINMYETGRVKAIVNILIDDFVEINGLRVVYENDQYSLEIPVNGSTGTDISNSAQCFTPAYRAAIKAAIVQAYQGG